MFKLIEFEILQARYIKAAMDEIATFRPDGKTPADAQALIDAVVAAQGVTLGKKTALDLARGEVDEAVDALHLACTQVYPIMKVRYRTDPGSMKAINLLPVQDRSRGETLARGDAMSSLWGQLPNPPGSATPFKAWETMGKAAFDEILGAAKTKLSGLAAVDQDFQVEQGTLNDKAEQLEDFVTSALITGRAQYPPGTPEREVIDAIPTVPAQQPPDPVVISVATSPAAGAAHLEFAADGATSFDILQKGPGDPDFSFVANDIITTSYDATGLADGDYEFKVIGRNSQGPGPESAVSTIAVSTVVVP